MRFTTSYNINGTPIASTSTHPDLGITISSRNEHYNIVAIAISQSLSYSLGLLIGVRLGIPSQKATSVAILIITVAS